VKFQTNFRVSAAILDWWAGSKQHFLRLFVDNLYTDKVTRAFSQIPIGYDAAAKNLPGGNFTPPMTTARRVKPISTCFGNRVTMPTKLIVQNFILIG
jgi:hypothetical protein